MVINNQLTKMKILIVDDNPEAISVLGHTLPKWYTRQIALSGERALEILGSSDELPDLIILDVMLPGIDGFAVCKSIKRDTRLKDIPIIFISALNESFDKVTAFNIGGADYITKPFESTEVLARVSTQLEIAQSRKKINDLYSKTLQGTIHALNVILAMANPEVSRISNTMQLYSEIIMKELLIKNPGDLKLACLLSGLGILSDPVDKGETGYFADVNNSIKSKNINIPFDITKIYDSLTLSAKIIENIPRFDSIIRIIRISMSPLDKKISFAELKQDQDKLKGHILRILIYYVYNLKFEKNHLLVLKQMSDNQEEYYIPEVLNSLYKIQNTLSSSVNYIEAR